MINATIEKILAIICSSIIDYKGIGTTKHNNNRVAKVFSFQ